MEEHAYKIVFNGKIAAGQDPAEVKERLSRIFKLDEDRVEQLLSGSRLVLKRNLSQEAAVKYKQAFDQSGAVCSIEREGGIELRMEDGKLHETPEKAGAGARKPNSGGTMGEVSSSGNVYSSTKGRTMASTAYTDSRESANDTKLEVSETSEFQGWWESWGARVTGLLTGSFVFNVVSICTEAFGLQEDPRVLVAAVAGVASWYFSRRWAREKGDDRSFCLVILAVALVMAMAGTAWRYSRKEPVMPAISTAQKKMSVTESKLEDLRIAMNAIQGLALGQDVPFPETQEDILKIIKTYRQVFPPSVWKRGPDLFKDEWGEPIHYEGHSDMRYFIRSAGPDKIHGTEDDKTITN